MKKVIFTLSMIFALILFVPSEANAVTYAKGVVLDGQQINMEEAPIIENGRTLVPMRGVLEAMGASVTWDPSTKTATAFFEDNSASVTIDELTAYTNGYPVTLDVPAKIVNGRTMVPLRFMAEAIGYEVSFSDGWVYLDTPMSDDYNDLYSSIVIFDAEIVQPEMADEETIVTTSYNEEKNAVIVTIESYGLAGALKIAADDEAFESEWNEFKDSMKDLSNTIVTYFDASGHEVNGIVEVIDDEDNEYLIMEITNGNITYDGTVN